MKRKPIITFLTVAAACAGLAACSTPPNPRELTQKTVRYTCEQDGSRQPLSVQYTFQNGEALAAKVIFGKQAVDLTRATTSNADMVGNTFRGNGYTWTTDKFNEANAATANGNMFTRDEQSTANGQSASVSTILASQCKVSS